MKKRFCMIFLLLTAAVLFSGYCDRHSWQEADCKAPETCLICGETRGMAEKHDFVDDRCSICGKELLHSSVWSYYILDADGTARIQNCSRTFVSLTIPSELGGVRVTSIDQRAFLFCDAATEVFIPYGVTELGDLAFYACSHLHTVILPDTLTYLGSNPFYQCPVTRYSLSDSHPYLEVRDGVLLDRQTNRLISYPYGSTASGYTVPEGTREIGSFAFHSAHALTAVRIPDSVEAIGDYAFTACSSLTSLTLPEGLTSIGAHAFTNCQSLVSASIPESVSFIGDHAFSCASSSLQLITPAGSYAESFLSSDKS